MSKAFKCDMCKDYHDGEGWIVRRHLELFNIFPVLSRSYQLCRECYRKVVVFVEEGDRK